MTPHPLDGVAPELLAKQVLGRLPRRAVVGERLVERVGGRAWRPPRFARGRAIFVRIGLPDPWDPDAKDTGTGLGDVALPQPRQPAPHLSPPAGPKPPAAKGPTLPPGLANAPAAETRTDSPSRGKPAPKIGDVRKVDPAELRPKEVPRPGGAPPPKARSAPPPPAFGPGPVKHAVVRLPMRPGVVVPGAEPEPGVPDAAARSVSPAPPVRPVVASSPPPSAAAPPRPVASSPPPSAAAPPRPVASSPPPSAAAPPRPPPPAVAATQAPPASAEAPAAPKPAAPVNRKPPGPSAGLDDLFGMGGGDNTRIRMPKAEPAAEAGKPRRPMVTSPEELARLGLDRRPPAAKPPSVTPSSPASTPPPEPEPDE